MTAETCVLMGMVKAKTGEYKTALNLFEDAVLTLKGTLGAKHLSVTKTLAQIGQLHFQLSCYDKAFASLQEAERIQLETVGEMNRDTLETQALIGRVLTATGEYDSASNKLKSVHEKQQSLFGVNHPSIAETNQFIAENFLEQGMSSFSRWTRFKWRKAWWMSFVHEMGGQKGRWQFTATQWMFIASICPMITSS